MNDNKLMNRAADNIRILSAAMVGKSQIGAIQAELWEVLTLSMFCFLNFLYTIPKTPLGRHEIAFSLDPGHMSANALCAIGLNRKIYY